jgi:hypothetical protein
MPSYSSASPLESDSGKMGDKMWAMLTSPDGWVVSVSVSEVAE